MHKLPKSTKHSIYRMFARGEDLEQVAAAMEISLRRIEKQYLHYIGLPLGEKLRLTLLPESVTNRLHRLADDVRDIDLIDAMLPTPDGKKLASLLDIKRKIKERMMKDSLSAPDPAPTDSDIATDEEIFECYNKIFANKEAEQRE
jgi:hypothetical protein